MLIISKFVFCLCIDMFLPWQLFKVICVTNKNEVKSRKFLHRWGYT
jgi:hypothetical protein